MNRMDGLDLSGLIRIDKLKTGRMFADNAGKYQIVKIFIALILWTILFVICWPIALLAIVVFPILWLILLPFRIIGLTLELIFKVIGAILLFPFRIAKSI